MTAVLNLRNLKLIDFFIDADTQALIFFNSLRAPFWDGFFLEFSGKFVWVPMYLFLIIAFYKSYNWKTATFFVLSVIISIALADQICAHLIRPFFQRLRPSNVENPISQVVRLVDGYRAGGYGFPSCHAANSFALFMITSILLRRKSLSLFLLFWASINCYSRIYLAAHYPGDILIGALIGFFIGYIIGFVSTNIIKNKKVKHFKSHDASDLVILVGMVTIAVLCMINL